MTIDDSTLLHLAKLSRLHIAPEDMSSLKTDMQQMLSFIEQLSAVDTIDIPPLHHAAEAPICMSSDVPEVPLQPLHAVALAPDHEGSFFIVPKVIS